MRILWLKTELLHPVDKGGKIRTYAMLRELKSRHHVVYLTLDEHVGPSTASAQAQEYCHELVRIPLSPPAKYSAAFYAHLVWNLLSPVPYAVDRYRSRAMKHAITRRLAADRFDLIVCDFLMPTVNIPPRIDCPTILFQHNVEALLWERHYQSAADFARRVYFKAQWRKMLRYEGAVCRRFDHIVVVSPQDLVALQDRYAVDHVSAIPTGVDTGYFRSNGGRHVQSHELVFTGSMDWMPNEDAICHFMTDILPRIQAAVPDVTLTVVGRDPTPRLRRLASHHPAVAVVGGVPDVRPYIERAAAYVVPLRIGGGTRLKIYEALAMGKAVVSTSIGAEGLDVRSGRDLLVRDTGDGFAQGVVELLTNPPKARALGRTGAQHVRTRYDWPIVTREFERICERVAGQRMRCLR